ncbi:MAG TPA: hypothetical protein VII49_08220 [Rhizomicrobium sp.]
MSLRFSLAAAAALFGLAALATPASAMQIIQIPDPNAPAADATPDGVFDKSFPDSWQKKPADGQQGASSFHFTMSGASGGFGTQSPSAYGDAKQAGSEFYQPMLGYQVPLFGR